MSKASSCHVRIGKKSFQSRRKRRIIHGKTSSRLPTMSSRNQSGETHCSSCLASRTGRSVCHARTHTSVVDTWKAYNVYYFNTRCRLGPTCNVKRTVALRTACLPNSVSNLSYNCPLLSPRVIPLLQSGAHTSMWSESSEFWRLCTLSIRLHVVELDFQEKRIWP